MTLHDLSQPYPFKMCFFPLSKSPEMDFETGKISNMGFVNVVLVVDFFFHL